MPPPIKSNSGETSSEQDIMVYNSNGVKLTDGPPKFSGKSPKFEVKEAKVKHVCVSDNGKRLAWISGGEVCVVEGPEWKRIGTLQHPKAVEACFSPNGSFLAIWDIYSQAAGVAPVPNMSVYDVSGRKLLKAFVQKSHVGWQPQWTRDESLMARMTTSQVHFYEGKDLENVKVTKAIQKLRSFSLSPSSGHHHCTFFVPSLKGAPAFVQMFKYPNVKDNSSLVASKSFFKVDSVESFWNASCSAVLLLTTAEVDKSGTSYYGEQMLFFLSTRGDSNRVTFSKDGQIRSVSWCPSNKEFFCVYGLSPAKATMFNLKCDPVAEFGEASRNLVMVNPPGNLVLIGGMGNISSRFEIWDVKENKIVSKQECSDITHMEWSPCGQYILTSTCSPRLRVNNGYKIWHYTATLLNEVLCPQSEELFGAAWVKDWNRAKAFEVSTKPVKGIQSQVKKASNERYVPPSQRAAASQVGNLVDTSKKYLSQRDNPAQKEEDAKEMEKLKQKLKKKEKREEAKKKKEEEKGMNKDWREERKEEEKKAGETEKKKDNVAKRIKNINKKLESIQKLKADKEEGKYLDNGQLEKIKTEQELVKELEEISIT